VHTINSEVEEEDFTPCLDGKMKKSNDQKKNTMLKTTHPENTMMDSKKEKEGMKLTTPRLEMGSNDVNNKPRKIGYA
jgi:chemotaxis response regulator CheB